MFKCKECGTEYNTKPDFCDCGNDTFVEVAESLKKGQDILLSVPKRELASEKSDYKDNDKKTEVLSYMIFLFCITFALIVIFFIGNPKKETVKPVEIQDTKQQTLNLPSIDSLWNNSTAGIINNEKSKQNQIVQPVNKKELVQQENPILSPVVYESKQPKQQPLQTTAQPPVKANPIVQKIKQSISVAPKTQSAATQKTAQTATVPRPNIPKATQAIANGQSNATTNKTQSAKHVQRVQQSSQNTAAIQTPPVQKTTQQNNTQTTAVNIPASTTLRPKTTIDTQALKKELDNYKIGLRNTIGKKIDFTSVIGDGDCTVSFKIAANGKLTNRVFSKQSSNITLNDAVYSAVMSTPAYNPPPAGYNNETMNLKIRFYNGNFDISLN